MSDEAIWRAVDHYIVDEPHPRGSGARGGAQGQQGRRRCPQIDVSPAQGALLNLLVRITRREEDPRDRHARRLLDDLDGPGAAARTAGSSPSSTIRTTPRSRAANIARAGLGEIVDVQGRRGRSASCRSSAGEAPFDFVFIDADKPNNPHYIDWAVKLGRPGTVVIVDNVIRDGEVIQEHSDDANVRGARAALRGARRQPRLRVATAVQTVGAKGYDGFAIATAERAADRSHRYCRLCLAPSGR